MVTITGTLTNAASKAITDCTIILKAKKTTSNVLVKTEAHEVSETGAYNMSVQPGLYDVVLLENGFPPKQLGTIEVKSNSKTGTLNDFLILPVTGEVVSSELLDQLVEERTLAQTAADNAKTSETNAKNSANSAANTLSGAVKKTGDTMSGALSVPSLTINGKSGLKTGDALRLFSFKENSGGAMKWVKLATLKPTANGVGNLQLLISGTGNYAGYAFGVDIVDLSSRNSTPKIRVTRLSSAITDEANYGYVINDKGDFDFYVQLKTYNTKVNVSILNNPDTSIVTFNDSLELLKTVPEGLVLSDNIVTPITTDNISKNNILQKGDLGIATVEPDDGTYTKKSAIIYVKKDSINSPLSTSPLVGISCLDHVDWGMQILGTDGGSVPKVFVRTIGYGEFKKTAEFITSANSTVDSNGFYKKASPIVRLINLDSDYGENMEGYTQIGAGYANSEAAGVEVKYIDVGHYEIHGSLGFAKSGWYITLPEDGNGNKKIFAEYSQDENGVITVKCFTRKFDIELCEIVADKPTDIPESRWIDIRLDMPEVENFEDEVIEDDLSIDDEVTQEPETTE